VQFRSVSTKTATDYNVVHESPQILIIKNGKCIYDTSHMSISVDVIKEQLP
jgi:bacillithiol system protein YtxJ